MYKFISKDFLMDEELNQIVGGDVLPNNGTDQAHPAAAALANANDNAAFNRQLVSGTVIGPGCSQTTQSQSTQSGTGGTI